VEALSGALKDPAVGVAGSKIFYPDGETIQHAGAWIEWPLGLTHHFSEPGTGPHPIEFVTGAAIAFRREVLERVGLLDEGFWPGYFEDVDYCLRVREAGYEVRYVPEAMLDHAETTSVTDLPLLSRYYQRGRLRFVLKHLPPERFLREFVPAEAEYQPAAIHGRESMALRLGYIEAIPVAGVILRTRWRASRPVIQAVTRALEELHHLAWMNEQGRVLGERAAPSPSSLVSSPPEAVGMLPERAPILRPYAFRSAVPVLGPLISRFRTLWYNVAARWGIEDLRFQQQAINEKLHEQMETLQAHAYRQVMELATENELLSREI
jgi:hypothetical protein